MPVDALRFPYFTKNLIIGKFDQPPAATANTHARPFKLLQLPISAFFRAKSGWSPRNAPPLLEPCRRIP